MTQRLILYGKFTIREGFERIYRRRPKTRSSRRSFARYASPQNALGGFDERKIHKAQRNALNALKAKNKQAQKRAITALSNVGDHLSRDWIIQSPGLLPAHLRLDQVTNGAR